MAAILALAAALLQPVTAPAQPVPEADIIVQGVRPSPHQLRDFVRALTQVPSYGQIGRFHDKVCPVAMGLGDSQNARITARMRQVATAAQIPLGGTGCIPNAFVIVAPDKAAAIRDLNRRFPVYFTAMSDREIRDLARSPEPVAAWQILGLLTADGEEAAKTIGADYYTVRSVNTPSRIRAASKPTFRATVVVIDVKAATGLTVTQLADYAAMRTFADIEPARIAKVGVPSILSAVGAPDSKPVPVTLTHWDLAFLTSLYATDNSYLATYQRGDMEQVIKRNVEQTAPGAPPR